MVNIVRLYALCVPFSLLISLDASKNVTGTWTNPAGENVTFQHNVSNGSLQLRWPFNSQATGPVVLHGRGSIEISPKNELSFSIPIETFPLWMNGKVCETKSIQFSSEGKLKDNFLFMKNCNIKFVVKCEKEEPKTVYNVCNGRWE